MIGRGQFLGQIVLAGRAGFSLSADDFAVMRAAPPLAAAVYFAQGGPNWPPQMYPPDDAFRVSPQGL